MTERARNIVIAVVLAGVAALLVGLYVSNYQRHVRNGEEHVTVYTATRDIPAGTLRAVQVQGNANQLLAGTIRHGDHVDLVATFKYKADDNQNATYAATRTVL